MKLATERQKEKMKKLDIEFDDETTLEEAAELIRAESQIKSPDRKTAGSIPFDGIAFASDWED